MRLESWTKIRRLFWIKKSSILTVERHCKNVCLSRKDWIKKIQNMVKILSARLKKPTKNVYVHHKLISQRIIYQTMTMMDGWMSCCKFVKHTQTLCFTASHSYGLHQRNSARKFVYDSKQLTSTFIAYKMYLKTMLY